MDRILVKLKYLGAIKEDFFGGDKLNYHQFSVVNSAEIPDFYFTFPEKKVNSFVYILESHLRKQVKKTPLVKNKDYDFTLNLEKVGPRKAINFGLYTDYGDRRSKEREFKNTLILKNSNYFERAVKSEIKPADKDTESNVQKNKNTSTNPKQNNLVKILLIISPLLVFALFFILLAKLISKKRKL